MNAVAPREQRQLGPELKAAYLRFIEKRLGLRITEHQTSYLEKAIAQTLRSSKLATPRELLEGFSNDTVSLESFTPHLTVGETHFFRVAPQIEALRQVVLPDLISRQAHDKHLRLWSAGCSTGEEAYTLAILLYETLPMLSDWQLSLLATDINAQALEIACRGTYGAWSFRETPGVVRERHFSVVDKGWQLSEAIKRMVKFETLNLAGDAFPSQAADAPKLDLILCRNVTLYFSPEATQRLYRRFAETLRPGGWLVLGPSDPVPDVTAALEVIHLPGAVLWRRPLKAPEDVRTLPPEVPYAPKPLEQPLQRIESAWPASASSSTRRADQQHAAPDLAVSLKEVKALAEGGAREAARQKAEAVVAACPLEAPAHLLLGMLYLEQGSFELALESLRRATFLEPNHALAHFGLGQAYLRLGSIAQAKAALTHTQRLLTALADDQPVPGETELSVLGLRQATHMQLSTFAAEGKLEVKHG